MLLHSEGEECRHRRCDHCMLVSVSVNPREHPIANKKSFTSQETYDTYLSSEPKIALDQVCIDKKLLHEPSREQRLIPAAGFAFRSTGLFSAPGIHVAMGKIDYAPGTRCQGIAHWSKVAASVEEHEREGTHTYWFLTDTGNADVLYSLERYRDERYLWDIHVPSLAIQQNIKTQKHIRTGLLLRQFESVE
jgi:quinol monooxygenase YgiN